MLMLGLLVVLLLWLSSRPEETGAFNVHFDAETPPGVPRLSPTHTITLDPSHAGEWVVLGDVDGDGEMEIVSARNVDENDVHFTSAVVAQRFDGTVLWRWGNPAIGRAELHHDVACQIYDWDGDGLNEVVLATEGYLVELEGATGRERRRLPLPPKATDCLVFANLSGGPRATDILVKDRYWNLWAFSREWQLLWQIENPGGYRTSHQPLPLDLDGDGRDEIMAGYALLDPAGEVRWVLQSEGVDLAGAHLDCTRVVRTGARPEDFRLVHTYCGVGALAMTDGLGQTVWEINGHHFESLDVGKIRADVPGLQIVVDLVDFIAPGQNPTWLLDEEGRLLGQFTTPYSRFHSLVDWNGDGLEEIVLADVPLICDGHGQPLARLSVNEAPTQFLRVGDLTGDGRADICIHNQTRLHVFTNPSPTRPATPARPGSGVNATLY
jgi:hypothetical protein